MRLETDVRDFMLGAPSIAALVSDRIYGLIRESGAALPSINVQRIHSMRQQLFCGVAPLVSAELQIDSFGIDGDDAWTLAKALRKLFANFRGPMGNSPQTIVDIVFLVNEFPLIDPDPGVIRVVQIYNFWYLED